MNANWVTQLSRKCLRKQRAFIQGALARKLTPSGKIQITARRRGCWWTVRFSRQYPARGRPSLLWVHSPTSRGSSASPVLNLLTGVITASRGCLRQGELEGGRNSALTLSLKKSLSNSPWTQDLLRISNSQMKELNLSSNNLNSLPGSFYNLVRLVRLNLSDNRLVRLSSELELFSNLEYLNVSRKTDWTSKNLCILCIHFYLHKKPLKLCLHFYLHKSPLALKGKILNFLIWSINFLRNSLRCLFMNHLWKTFSRHSFF